MSAAEIVGSLFSAYAVGWAWATSMLVFKRLSESST